MGGWERGRVGAGEVESGGGRKQGRLGAGRLEASLKEGGVAQSIASRPASSIVCEGANLAAKK